MIHRAYGRQYVIISTRKNDNDRVATEYYNNGEKKSDLLVNSSEMLKLPKSELSQLFQTINVHGHKHSMTESYFLLYGFQAVEAFMVFLKEYETNTLARYHFLVTADREASSHFNELLTIKTNIKLIIIIDDNKTLLQSFKKNIKIENYHH